MTEIAVKLKRFIYNKEFRQSVQLLEQELIKFVVKAIREKEKDFEYTDIYSLIDSSNKYIDDDRKKIANQIRFFSFEIENSENTYRLLEICEEYKII